MKKIKLQVLKNYLEEYTKEELALGLITHVCKQKEDEIEMEWLNECVDILAGGDFERREETRLEEDKIYQEMRNAQRATNSQYYTS
tara:strand:+ start:608 stop:865 length:258 start_codon:yes stop_codon:yes gene_type:complete